MLLPFILSQVEFIYNIVKLEKLRKNRNIIWTSILTEIDGTICNTNKQT